MKIWQRFFSILFIEDYIKNVLKIIQENMKSFKSDIPQSFLD